MISKRVLLIAAAVLVVAATGATAAQVNVDNFTVSILSIAPDSTLNLQSPTSWGIVRTDVLHPVATSYATVNGYLATGWDSGIWDGVGGIISTATTLGPVNTLGVWTDSDWALVNGSPTFAGQTVQPNSVLTKVTVIGDADGDGVLTSSDYSWIDAAWAGGYAGKPAPWALGDFDHDGILTSSRLRVDRCRLGSYPCGAGPLGWRCSRAGFDRPGCPRFAVGLVGRRLSSPELSFQRIIHFSDLGD